jgi:hypothetical protein
MGKDNSHYSEKGGHKQRSEFWRSVKDLEQQMSKSFRISPVERSLAREQAQLIRRTMFRDPRDGR